MIRGAAAVALIALAGGCLSASEGGSGADRDAGGEGDGGDGGGSGDGDAGPVGTKLVDCPPGAVDYFGGAAGDLDGDEVDDIVLLRDSLEPSLRGLEIRLSSDLSPRCLETALHTRGVLVGDILPGAGPEDILLLGFDTGGRRYTALLSGGVDALSVMIEHSTDVEGGFNVYDPYDLDAVDGPNGWQVIYGGPSAGLSDTESSAAPTMHALEGPDGEAIGEVLAVTLVEVEEDVVRAFVVTASWLYWFDALAILGDGAVRAEEKLLLPDLATAAVFGDFQLGAEGADGCPDLAIATGALDPRVVGYNLTCEPVTVEMGPTRSYEHPVFADGEDGIHLRTHRMDTSVAEELLVFGLHTDGTLFVDGKNEVRFDEVPGDDGWECTDNASDLVIQLCGAGGNSISVDDEVDWVRTFAVAGEGDTHEIVFVGAGGLEGCVARSGNESFVSCD